MSEDTKGARNETSVEGGCMCGRVRYAVSITDNDGYLCHCRMCQRAGGGLAIAFKNVPKDSVTWTTPEPDYYKSSPIARRGHCADCGTPLTFDYPDSEHIDLTIGSFDDPIRFTPTHHFGAENIHEAWLDTRALPRKRTDEYEPLVKRWKDTIGKLPE
ncbi:GFA family protein [Parasphingopyxis sp. CP4]|uniref:GFA family protein n=1 Tax=Parasphingopyxis sp. CP4 TaxID=2724527 RepID=UPI0015A3CDE0|nr:GFA family protein [Parasphingopyxis sp. CP4]QLC21582.1 GFA family protein [Parasphingopyxis sp. CP4]